MYGVGGHSWSVGRQGGAARSYRSSSSRSSQRRKETNRSSFLVRVIDACLLCLLFLAPLLMGGRHPVGYFAWTAIASVLGLATVLHYRSAKPSAGDYVWLAAAGLVILQLIPMPPSLLTWLNPGLGKLLPGLVDPSSLPFGEAIYGDRPISINPYRTRLALGMLLSYGVIFHAVTRRVQTPADVRRLLGWMATATVAIAILALAQRFAGNGKFLWIYQHISRSASDVVKGPFQNQNHLAQLMALGLGPLLYFATSRSGQWKTVLATCGATLCLLTGLLTFSRGGAIAIATAAFIASGGLAYSGHVSRQRWLRLVLPALVTLILLGISGGERLLARVETLTGSTELSAVAAGRLELWQSHLKAIAASPWVGYGAATHEDIYPAFMEKDFGVKFTHGESGYLPVQLENGLPGTLLLICALSLATRCARQSLCSTPVPTALSGTDAGDKTSEMRTLAVACIAGLAASAVQSLGDFVWYIPACLTPALMLVASLYRLSSVSRAATPASHEHRTRSSTPPWLVLPVAGLIVALTWSLGPARVSHFWDRYRILTDDPAAEVAAKTTVQDPSAERVQLLQAIIHGDPANPLPRLRLAAALLSEGHSSASPRNLLQVVSIQAVTALRTAPLRGEGYIFLADACRRAGGDSGRLLALLEQAIEVRRCETDIRFRAGLIALRAGNLQWGIETWKPVMETPTRQRDQILVQLAEVMPAEVLLNLFSLDRTALSALYYHFRTSDPQGMAQSTQIGHLFVEALVGDADRTEDEFEAAMFLYGASQVLEEIRGPEDQILELASRAVATAPSQFKYRVRLTSLLIRAKRFDAAKQHLRWCQSRQPTATVLQQQEQLLSIGLSQQYKQSLNRNRGTALK